MAVLRPWITQPVLGGFEECSSRFLIRIGFPIAILRYILPRRASRLLKVECAIRGRWHHLRFPAQSSNFCGEEIDVTQHRGLPPTTAIQFFKTRFPEHIMRSLRAITFRAAPDDRELSLLRAMALEVVRFLERTDRIQRTLPDDVSPRPPRHVTGRDTSHRTED